MKKAVQLFVVGAVVGVLFYIYIYFSEYGILSLELSHYLISIIIGFTCTLAIHAEHKLFNKWLSWKKSSGLRLLVGVVFNTVTVSLIAVITIGAAMMLSPETLEILVSDLRNIGIKLGILTVFGCLVFNIIYFALYSYNQYSVVQIDTIKSDRHQLELQFEALKSQLSPHYLFNSLNTISSLIYKDTVQAEDFIRRLAKSYNYILSTNKSKYVNLDQEIEFVHTYNYLLQVRFQNNIHFDINLPDDLLQSKIPPLALQMLVENAVKHNVVNSEHPLYIRIGTDNKHITIRNNKTQVNKNKRSFKIGLSNIKKRYKLISDSQVKIEDGEDFKVLLPIIHFKNSDNYSLKSA